MKSHTEYLQFNTEKRTQILNITPKLAEIVAKSGVQEGHLDFGPWEQVHYAEFDGMRKKRVLVKIIGE